MPTGISHLGTNGDYNSLFSTDVVGQNETAVFVMVFGSWFGNWDGTDNFMRSFLATPTLGLACCMAGRPHWFLHHMGLGETIGYGTRLSMNNSTLYQNQSNGLTRAIYISLMGDPSLRMDRVAPPATLTGAVGVDGVHLDWSPSPENVLGYYVYRWSSPTNSFNRLTGSLLTNANFLDTNAPSGNCTYMVRAVNLQTTPSGTYFNASQGIFVNVTVPIQIVASIITNSVTLTWNSQSGTVYRVLAENALSSNGWSDVSGGITSSGPKTSWTEIGVRGHSQRFYRVTTP